MALIEGRNLRKTYNASKRNRVDALRGVDITVEAGEMIAITGPSGSGKSTLMHILGLLHSPDVNGGPPPELSFEGQEMVALKESERTRIRAKRMGFVFQDFNLVPTLTARENVMLACDYAGKGGTEARAATLDALTLVGLAERVDHRPAELSGGEQQRVAIARALVNRPNLVLADEPTGNLDSEHADDILAVLRRFNREQGLTVILVTHDSDVSRACDRTVSVRDGMIRAPAGEPHMPEVRPVMMPVDAAPEPVLVGASRG